MMAPSANDAVAALEQLRYLGWSCYFNVFGATMRPLYKRTAFQFKKRFFCKEAECEHLPDLKSSC